MRGRNSNISQKLNNALFFISGVLVVVIIGIAVMTVNGRQQDNDDRGAPVASNSQETSENEKVEKWQEGAIFYNGDYYKYNINIKSYLLMGIDSDDPVQTAPDGVSGGQSDALFLIVVDAKNETMSVISINRNTMTEIEAYDEKGNSLGTVNAQICTQHGFGDGKKQSCTRTVEAVENLFYNVPINGYAAINMGAIPTLNDAIGGVRLKVLQDLYYPNRGVDLTEGEMVTLDGDEAYVYLRGRDIHDFDSATDRLRRQEQYIVNYMNQLKGYAAGDPELVVNIYNSVEDYLVSDVNFASLVEQLMDYEFSDDVMYTVPGDTQMGEQFEEYIVDDEAFYDLIIKIFYTKVEEP